MPPTSYQLDTHGTDTAPRRFWIGLVAIVIYVALAAILSNALDDVVRPDSVVAEFALTHFVALPILLAAGLWFSRWSGWSKDIWSQAPAFAAQPRRRWMLAVPALLAVQSVLVLFDVPWSDRSAGFILIVAIGTIMVGLGEELYYRGILRVSLRANHGELVTVVVCSVLFGASHSIGTLTHGIPVGFVAFQVAVTGMNGVLYYAAFTATGTLWVPIALHAFTDFSLYVQSGEGSAAGGDAQSDPNALSVVVQLALTALSVIVLVSAALEDRRARNARRA